MKERGEEVHLPPVPAQYLIDWWREIGPTEEDGPISWLSMTAWERLTGVELLPWEARLIRSLSSAFVSQRYDAKKPDCPPPWSPERPQQVRNKVAVQFAAMIGALAKR